MFMIPYSFWVVHRFICMPPRGTWHSFEPYIYTWDLVRGSGGNLTCPLLPPPTHFSFGFGCDCQNTPALQCPFLHCRVDLGDWLSSLSTLLSLDWVCVCSAKSYPSLTLSTRPHVPLETHLRVFCSVMLWVSFQMEDWLSSIDMPVQAEYDPSSSPVPLPGQKEHVLGSPCKVRSCPYIEMDINVFYNFIFSYLQIFWVELGPDCVWLSSPVTLL